MDRTHKRWILLICGTEIFHQRSMYLNDLAHHDMIYQNDDVRVVESRMIQVMTNTGGDETAQFEVGKILC